MRQLKFKVSIPNPNQDDENKYTCYNFASIEDVCQYLEISANTAYALRTGRLKLVHNSKKKLQGVKIEKIDIFYSTKPDLKKIEDEILEYRKKKTLSTDI